MTGLYTPTDSFRSLPSTGIVLTFVPRSDTYCGTCGHLLEVGLREKRTESLMVSCPARGASSPRTDEFKGGNDLGHGSIQSCTKPLVGHLLLSSLAPKSIIERAGTLWARYASRHHMHVLRPRSTTFAPKMRSSGEVDDDEDEEDDDSETMLLRGVLRGCASRKYMLIYICKLVAVVVLHLWCMLQANVSSAFSSQCASPFIAKGGCDLIYTLSLQAVLVGRLGFRRRFRLLPHLRWLLQVLPSSSSSVLLLSFHIIFAPLAYPRK